MKMYKNLIILFAISLSVAQFKIKDMENQKSSGLDVSLGMGQSLISVPGVFSGVEADGGISFSGRFGVYFLITDILKIKMGLQKWSKIYNEDLAITDNMLGDGILRTESEFSYFGVYFELIREWPEGYLGGGFEFSISKKFSISSISAYGEYAPTQFLREAEDGFKNRVENQADFYFTTGVYLVNNEKLLLSPFLKFSIPTSSLYDLGTKEYKVAGFYFNFGMNAEISL